MDPDFAAFLWMALISFGGFALWGLDAMRTRNNWDEEEGPVPVAEWEAWYKGLWVIVIIIIILLLIGYN